MTHTPTPLTTLIKEMREASEKATLGQWFYDFERTSVRIKRTKGLDYYVCEAGYTDGPHIALCNPENIRRVLDALDEMREALERFSEYNNTKTNYIAEARAVLAKHFPEESK